MGILQCRNRINVRPALCRGIDPSQVSFRGFNSNNTSPSCEMSIRAKLPHIKLDCSPESAADLHLILNRIRDSYYYLCNNYSAWTSSAKKTPLKTSSNESQPTRIPKSSSHCIIPMKITRLYLRLRSCTSIRQWKSAC